MVATLLVLLFHKGQKQEEPFNEELESEMMSGMQAQTKSSDHLEFMGVAIDGNLSDFRARLIGKGFSLKKGLLLKDDSETLLWGRFANEDCIVQILTNDNTQEVYGVEVLFSQRYDSWNHLLNAYTSWKKIYTEKYGSPVKDRHTFSGYANYLNSDTSKMAAVDNGECHYDATFKPNKGTVMLAIVKSGFYEGRIAVLYKDRLNEQKAKSDVLDDI